MSSTFSELQAKVKRVPTTPGVYRWLDAKGTVLYVGKAKNLRARMKSYVQENPDKSLGPWKLSLIGKIVDFSITETANEREALVLETNLIKQIRPKYNVLMKDDKNYVYARISMQEAYPRISVVRRVEDDNAKYFGPFLKAWQLKNALDVLHDVLPFRACKESLDVLNRRAEKGDDSDDAVRDISCLDHQIGKCCGLCVGRYTQQEYRAIIDTIIRFFKGDTFEVKQAIKDQMHYAASEKNFERAAKLRDALTHIEEQDQQQIVSDTSGDNTDAIGVAIHAGAAHIVLLRERGGRVIDEMQFPLAGEAHDIADTLSQFIPQYYVAKELVPPTIVLQEELADVEVLKELLSDLLERKVDIYVPERGKKAKLLAMAVANAKSKLQQAMATWEAAAENTANALAELQEALQLPDVPKRIEGYDISHLSGTETVGSMVVIKNGKAANADYRNFTIRSLKEGDIDDYKALQEVLGRRLRHVADSLKLEADRLKEHGLRIKKHQKSDTWSVVHDKEMVACIRLLDCDKVRALCFPWIHANWQGKSLEPLLIRTALKSLKKGKVYTVVPSEYFDRFSALGFTAVHTVPEALNVRDAALCMMYEASKNKPDKSLQSIPDLLVIDGGKGQLSSVVSVLNDLHLSIPVIGLAKRLEEVFVPGRKESIIFPDGSQGRFLLMRLRDEAHRVANVHRKKRKKSADVHSALDDIPGVGEATKKKLLKEFGSFDGVQKASDAELRVYLSEGQLEALRKMS